MTTPGGTAVAAPSCMSVQLPDGREPPARLSIRHTPVFVAVLIAPKTPDSAPDGLYPCVIVVTLVVPELSVKSGVTVCSRIHMVEVIGSNPIAPTILISRRFNHLGVGGCSAPVPEDFRKV